MARLLKEEVAAKKALKRQERRLKKESRRVGRLRRAAEPTPTPKPTPAPKKDSEEGGAPIPMQM
jgi:hypothetical protein